MNITHLLMNMLKIVTSTDTMADQIGLGIVTGTSSELVYFWALWSPSQSRHFFEMSQGRGWNKSKGYERFSFNTDESSKKLFWARIPIWVSLI
jgi:hypothetical protein